MKAMKITAQEYRELRSAGERTFIHDIPHSGEISEGFKLADGAVIFEKLDFRSASYHRMTATEYKEAQAWRPHKIAARG